MLLLRQLLHMNKVELNITRYTISKWCKNLIFKTIFNARFRRKMCIQNIVDVVAWHWFLGKIIYKAGLMASNQIHQWPNIIYPSMVGGILHDRLSTLFITRAWLKCQIGPRRIGSNGSKAFLTYVECVCWIRREQPEMGVVAVFCDDIWALVNPGVGAVKPFFLFIILSGFFQDN